MKFYIKDFFSKCDQIGSFLRIRSHLLKKALMENFIFCGVTCLEERVRCRWLVPGYHCVKSVCIRSYSGPYFTAVGLNTERYGVSLRFQCKCGKMQTRITPKMDNFHAVYIKAMGKRKLWKWRQQRTKRQPQNHSERLGAK